MSHYHDVFGPDTMGKGRQAQTQTINSTTGAAAPHNSGLNELSNFPSVTSLLSAVTQCLQSGKLAEAIALCDRIVLLESNDPEVHCCRGVALARLGRLGDAEVAYRQAIALNPDFANAYNNLGNALCELGRLEEAEYALRRAVGLKPGCAQCHSNLGTALRSQGRLVEAEAAYRRAIALNSYLTAAHNNLGNVLTDIGRLDDAEQVLRHTIAFTPEYAEAFSNLGNVLTAQGRLKEAESVYRQAIALKADFAEAYNNLGNVLRDLGRLDIAEQALRHAIFFQPEFAEALSNLGNVLKEQGRLSEAKAMYERAIALKPDHAKAHSNLGNVLRDQGKLIEAKSAYRRAIALKPDFADGFNNLSVVLKDRGRLADAREAVEEAIRLLPGNAMYFLNLGELKQFIFGDPQIAAMETLAGRIASLPVKQQIELHFALAKAYEDVGRFDDSFQQLLAGNSLMRRQIAYDEAATLGAIEVIRTGFTPELMHRFKESGVSSAVPVFIVGMPRSGTTLIEQILASHSQVFGAGELPNFGTAVADIRPTEDRIFTGPAVSQQLRRLGARYVCEVSRLAPSAMRITDKMPSNYLFAGLIHLVLPNAHIIHAVRDPLDTCVSCFSKLFANGQPHTYDLAELGRYYRSYQALMQHWRHLLPPGRILEVCYEDVVADLEGQSRRIVAHCGLDWDPRCLAFHEIERPVRTASATQVRRPLYRSALGRARRYPSFLRPLRDELGV